MLQCRSGEATNCRSARSGGAASRARLGQGRPFRIIERGWLIELGRRLAELLQKRNAWPRGRICNQGGQAIGANFNAGAVTANEYRLPDRHRSQSDRRMAVENKNPRLR